MKFELRTRTFTKYWSIKELNLASIVDINTVLMIFMAIIRTLECGESSY